MEATITPAEEQAAQDELERARARREELAQNAQGGAQGADDDFFDPAEGSGEDEAGDGPQDASAVEPADEGESDGEQFVLVVGGKKPTEDVVRIMGGAVAVSGAPEGGFVKGENYVLRVVVRCAGHGIDDTEDGKTGQVVSTRKVDKLKVKSARVQKG